MISFIEFLAEANKGRKPLSATHATDISFLKKNNIDTTTNST